MALKRLKWLKYLFVGRTEGETEQRYWNEKRKRHLANEHTEGLVVGLGVAATLPPSLVVGVTAGRALDTEGNDPEIESPRELDLTALVPTSGEITVYITLRYNSAETEPYFVEEIGGYQNKYTEDAYLLEATTEVPSAPALELARIRLDAGTSEITDAIDPDAPGAGEIDLRYVKHSAKPLPSLADLSDVDPDEADAFNSMQDPSASNPIATLSAADALVAPVRNEVAEARGSQASLGARLDVMLEEDGSFKGITSVSPAVPLTGGGSAGDVPLGITNATPTERGAMSAADKAKLDDLDARIGRAIGLQNLLVNGSFEIDQRGGGTYAAPADGAYTLDGWRASGFGGAGSVSQEGALGVAEGAYAVRVQDAAIDGNTAYLFQNLSILNSPESLADETVTLVVGVTAGAVNHGARIEIWETSRIVAFLDIPSSALSSTPMRFAITGAWSSDPVSPQVRLYAANPTEANVGEILYDGAALIFGDWAANEIGPLAQDRMREFEKAERLFLHYPTLVSNIGAMLLSGFTTSLWLSFPFHTRMANTPTFTVTEHDVSVNGGVKGDMTATYPAGNIITVLSPHSGLFRVHRGDTSFEGHRLRWDLAFNLEVT